MPDRVRTTHSTRRTVLATVGGVLSTHSASARSSGGRGVPAGAGRIPDGTDGSAADRVARAASFEPRGRMPVPRIREAVVDGSGTVVYAATVDGFVTVSVRDPTNPRLLADHRPLLGDHPDGPLTNVWDLSVAGDRLLVGGPSSGDSEFSGIVLYDVRDPTNPERVAVYEVDTLIHNVFLTDDVAYLTTKRRNPDSALVFVDVRDDDPVEFGAWSPAEYGDWDPETCHDVVVADDVLYACYWDLGTWMVDVSTPTEPDAFLQVGSVVDPDAEDPGNELPGNAHYARPRADGDVLAVGKEAFENEETAIDGAPGGIELWDVSDPATATREFVLAAPPPVEGGENVTAHNFGWRGDRLYTSWNGGGVRVYDVGDPTAPRLLAAWRDADRTNFWTAVPIHEGLVGANTGYHTESGGHEGGGLLTFPEPTGDGEAARAMEPRALPTSTSRLPEPDRLWVRAPAETPTPERTTTPSSRGETATATPATGATTSATGTPGSEPSRIPGFGALAGLVGVAGGALAARRPGHDEE